MKTFAELQPSECRWPMTADKPYFFCGEPKLPGSSYCACHRQMSLAPAQPEPLRGQTLARLADHFAGSRLRAARYDCHERNREAVDTSIKMTLGNAQRISVRRADGKAGAE